MISRNTWEIFESQIHINDQIKDRHLGINPAELQALEEPGQTAFLKALLGMVQRKT